MNEVYITIRVKLICIHIKTHVKKTNSAPRSGLFKTNYPLRNEPLKIKLSCKLTSYEHRISQMCEMFEKSVHPRSQAVPGIMQILSHLSRHCYIYINYIYTPVCTSNYAYFYCLLNGQSHEIVCFLFESETNEEPT